MFMLAVINFDLFHPSYRTGEEPLDDDDDAVELSEAELAALDQKKQAQLTARSKSLQQRVECVDAKKVSVAELLAKHSAATNRGLKPDDLELRLFDLSRDDLDLLMASIKVLELCKRIDLEPQRLSAMPTAPLQALSGEDLFKVAPEEYLVPDAPPSQKPLTLPGTNRRPLKQWFRYTEVEKRVEIQVACMLDAIVELAVQDGVYTPNVEDVCMDAKAFPSLNSRVRAFEAWYAGEEGTSKIKGKGLPSLQRVVLAETFEAEHAIRWEDFTLSIPLPHEYKLLLIKGERERLCRSRIRSYAHSISLPEDYDDWPADDKFPPKDLHPPLFLPENYYALYEEAILTPDGVASRISMFQYQIDLITQSRRFSMNRVFWPPFKNRLGIQFMFPRVGLLCPRVTFPCKRYKLWPSRTRESYHMAEIAAWYSEKDLSRDDMLMRKAEKAGNRNLSQFNPELSQCNPDF